MSSDINYGSLAYKLLPRGDCWPNENEDTNLKKLMYALGDVVEDFDNTLADVMFQYYPSRAGMFLVDWEKILGLPKCPGLATVDSVTRLKVVLAMFRLSPYRNAQFFIDIAAVFGYPITVSEVVGHPFRIQINYDLGEVETEYFRVGESSAGDTLEYDPPDETLQCLLNYFKHSHTNLIFVVT